MKNLQGENFHKNGEEFERWVKQKIRPSSKLNRQQAIYQIPVVVHVIHFGEAVGAGTNISDAQILSQLSVLNKDFQRLNNDAGNTPADFQSVLGNMELEFVLAKQNPEGLSTNGIVRVQGPKSSWTMSDNYQLKSLSYWPAEDYLNVWVCNITDFLGFGQLPISNLSGLENSSVNRLTDGVVIAYNVFGSEDDGAFNLRNNYRKGRTTTHEVGHFLGLLHICGDDGGACDGSDYVTDTPNQAGKFFGCPTHPQTSCGVVSMFQNFMDHTNDDCMNLFTIGQVERMTAILENSPRRGSLLSSDGSTDPLPIANDLGIKTVISPLLGECNSTITPVLEVRNYGNNAISSSRIILRKDDVILETKDFNFGPALIPLESSTVSFSSDVFSSGQHTISFEIVLANNVADLGTLNNMVSQSLLIPETISIPFVENFNSVPTDWQIVNPDLKTTWQLASAPHTTITNEAMKMDFYNYEDNLGEIDLLITPVFNLHSEPAALLLFDVAYAQFQDVNDGLKIVVLSNCNADINQGIVVYNKVGTALATASATTDQFTPSNESEWRKEFIDLSAFLGLGNIQLAFIGINDWGNNLYLDNISLVTLPMNDLAIEEVISPRPVVCSNEIVPKLHIKNVGTVVSFFKVKVTLNGQSPTIQTFSGLNFSGNSEMELALSPITLLNGENTISFEVIEPNGLADVNVENNLMTAYAVVNDAQDEIPVRQNFEQSLDDQWISINPTGGMNWELKEVDSNMTLHLNAFNNPVIGNKSWFVTPVLDFSKATEASLSFNLSYALRGNAADQLHILASKDCGITYSDTIFDQAGSSLANGVTATSPWEPTNLNSTPPEALNLSSLAGQQEVRIAFVFTNRNGNNIYIDNIEYFITETPSIPISGTMEVYPVPASANENVHVIFKLPEKSTVVIEVIDLMGKTILSATPQNVLNQTYEFLLPDVASGIYIVRAKTSTGIFSKRIIIIK